MHQLDSFLYVHGELISQFWCGIFLSLDVSITGLLRLRNLIRHLPEEALAGDVCDCYTLRIVKLIFLLCHGIMLNTKAHKNNSTVLVL